MAGSDANGDGPTVWQRAWRIAELSEECGAQDPRAWALAQCGEDAELRDAVATLLADGAAEPAPAPNGSEGPDAVGPYELLHVIGRGGMGLVFKARHRELDRFAAVKLLTVSAAVPADHLERFQREARLLAGLDHPSIVRLFEAGRATDPDGRPQAWFAMELVEPQRSLLDHFDGREVAAGEWTAPFRQAAEAIGHAHAAGVLHRDIKPENLLVDADGRARVIDFGIGAALHDGLGEDDLTRDGHLIGTLNYLAPERLDGFDATPESDVYALGLVFEQAITGEPRFGFSTTPSGIASLREAQRRPAPNLAPRAPDELGWIIAKATDPDPRRRYATASELADDLLRLQRSEPLVAGPTGPLYRGRLFVQRHRTIVTATALVVLALAAGLIAAGSALVRESQALERERDARRTVQETAHDLEVELVANQNLLTFWRDVFERTPAIVDGVDYTFDAALDDMHAEAMVLTETGGDAAQRARILTLVGSMFAGRNDWERALQLIEPAQALYVDSGEVWSKAWFTNAVERHAALLALGRADDAAAVLEGLDARPDDARISRSAWLSALGGVARACLRRGDAAEAGRLFEFVIAEADMDVDHQRGTALSATHNLAIVVGRTDPERALSLYREIWDWRSTHEPEYGWTYRSARSGVEVLINIGRPSEGIEWADQALALADAHGIDPRSRDYLDVVENRARGLLHLDRFDEGLAVLEQVLADRRATSGERDRDVLVTAGQLAYGLSRASRYEESMRVHQELVPLQTEELGPNHYKTVRHEGAIASNLMRLGRYEEALEIHATLVPRMIEHLGPDHAETVETRGDQATTLSKLSRYAEARELAEQLMADLDVSDAVHPINYARHLTRLANYQSKTALHEEAVASAERAVAIHAGFDDRLPFEIESRSVLALTLAQAGDHDRARAELDATLALAEEYGLQPPDAPVRELIEAILAGG